jgi:hypothetical protein
MKVNVEFQPPNRPSTIFVPKPTPLTPTSPAPPKPKRPRRPRRGRSKRKVRACSFPQCDRTAFGDGVARYCTLTHRALASEFEVAVRVSKTLPAGAMYAELVTASDAILAYFSYMDAVRDSAMQDGMTDEQWRAIVSGDHGQDAQSSIGRKSPGASREPCRSSHPAPVVGSGPTYRA